MKSWSLFLFVWTFSAVATAAELPVFDTHIHYSHDAWASVPPADAIAALRRAGVKKAFVSSSPDEGTQRLYRQAPVLVVPVLRPYRKRGELRTWFKDQTVPPMISALLEANTYAGIGEFHIFGLNAASPVMRRLIGLAKRHRIFLHAHADTQAIDLIFEADPEARVLWAHAGFVNPKAVRKMFEKHARLWADLSFRYEVSLDGQPHPQWRQLMIDFPARFTLGTDTYIPGRWEEVGSHAQWARRWLSDLPPDLAERIAYKNAEALMNWTLGK